MSGKFVGVGKFTNDDDGLGLCEYGECSIWKQYLSIIIV